MKIRAHIIPLGYIEIELHKESKQLYNLLKAKGEIDRLKKLDHLGVMKYAWESAHHSRWEYIFLTMYLIDLCRNHKEFHLSSDVRFKNGIKISGSEYLKCLTMLLNLGHVPWTFVAEKPLLIVLNEDKQLRRIFLQLFDNDLKDFKTFARDIIDNGLIWKFHPLLAVLKIRRLLRNRKERKKWLQIIHSYFKNSGEKIERLLSLFRQIRYIAYLTLDSIHTPSPIGFNIVKLLSDRDMLISYLLSTQSPEVNPLERLAQLLCENIYLSLKTLDQAIPRETYLVSRIKRHFTNYSRKEFTLLLEKLSNGEFQEEFDKNSKYNTIDKTIRLSFSKAYPFSQILPTVNITQEQRKLQTFGIHSTLWDSPTNDFFVVYQASCKTNDIKSFIKLINSGFQFLRNFYHVLTKDEITEALLKKDPLFVQEEVFDTTVSDFVIQIFNTLFGNYIFELRNKDKNLPKALFGNLTILTKTLDSINLDNVEDRSYKKEIKAKAHLVKNVLKEKLRNRYSILTLSNLLLIEGNETKCEFDGILIVAVNKKTLSFYLVEVKSGKIKNKALKSLKEKLQKLKPYIDNYQQSEVKLKTLGNIGISFVELKVSC